MECGNKKDNKEMKKITVYAAGRAGAWETSNVLSKLALGSWKFDSLKPVPIPLYSHSLVVLRCTSKQHLIGSSGSYSSLLGINGDYPR